MNRYGIFGAVYALMLFDFIDRQVLVSMFPHLKSEWQLSDAELGSLAMVVSLAIGATAIPVALLVARWNRLRVLGAMGVGWSVATLLGAAAAGFWQLFTARLAVGVAQAGYGPVAGALLADMFPARSRSTALAALFSTAIIGSVLGVYFGGLLAAHYGWRAGLALAGGVSLLIALAMFTLRVRGSSGDPAPAGAESVADVPLLSRTMLLIYAGFTMLTLVAGTVVAWLPSYFNRGYELPVDQAGLAAAVVMISSAVGTLLLGWLADRWLGADVKRRLLIAALSAVSSSLLLTTAFSLEPGQRQYVTIVAGGLLMIGHMGPILAVVADLAAPGRRSASFAILVSMQNIVGLAGGPMLAGWLSDRYGLAFALQAVCALGLLGTVAFMLAAVMPAPARRLAIS